MRNIYIIIACLLSASLLKAQEFDAVKNLSPAAPEAAQFQKYGDIPVSYYTGTPNISIPLYTVQEYDISVPIGLSYHASGVKLTEMASWVGTGWSLSAGGMLSRSVRGKPDFVNHMDENGVDMYFGGPTIPTSLNQNDYDYVVNITNQDADAQPDEYYINFLGRSVKFYVNQSKQIIVDPSSKIKIDRPTTASPYWVVTDASGTKYTFGNTLSSREITKHNRVGGTQQDYVSAWYLTKIESATGHSVIFDYEIASAFTHIPNQRHHGSFTLITGIAPQACHNIQNLSAGNLLRGATGQPRDFKPVRLTKINYQRGGEDYSVEFVANTNREDAYDVNETTYLQYHKLDFLHVKQGNGKRLSYIFNYDNRRNGLWLMSLNRVSYGYNGFDGGIEETHSFEYHNYTNLPEVKSYDMDYWGLYNGAGNSASSNLIPYAPFYTNGADRDYNETYAKYGILTKLTYPTGGYNEFEYEPHTIASAGPGGEIVAGGIRIKKIITSTQGGPGSAPDMVREFVYKAPGASNSSGNRAAPYGNSTYTRLYYQCYDFQGDPIHYQLDNLLTFSSHSVNGGGFMSIGYSAVQELIGSGGSNGRNVYEFTHVSSPFYETGFAPQGFEEIFSPVYFNSLANGRMTRQLTQKKVGGSYETMKEVVNTYQTVVNTSDYIAGLATSMAVDGSSASTLGDALDLVKPTGSFLDVVAYLPYRIKPDWVKLTKTVEKFFEDGLNPIIKTTDYTKSNYIGRWYHDFTTSTKVTYGVSGDIETTSVVYPFDAPVNTINTALKNKYIMTPLSATTIKGALSINQSVVLGGSRTSYASQTLTVDGININLPLPTEQYQLTQGTYGAGAGGQDVLLGKFVSYNADGLPTEVEDAVGHKTGLLWHNDLLLATCANASVSEFLFQGFEYSGGTSGNAHTGNQFKSGDYTVVFPVSGSRKYKVSYWYRSGSNWLYQEKAYTGTGMILSEGDAIDDVRVYPVDALMTTYTHDTFYGLTSQAGPGNRPMYYIYDAAGRLKLLKDQDGNIVQAYDHKFLASTTD